MNKEKRWYSLGMLLSETQTNIFSSMEKTQPVFCHFHYLCVGFPYIASSLILLLQKY